MKRRGGSLGDDPNQIQIDWNAVENKGEAESDSGKIVENTPTPKKIREERASWQERVVARLPVPRPLPASVAAGRFGHDEDGKVIRPGADEVRAITVNQADKLIDMLDLKVKLAGNAGELNRLDDSFRSLLAAYEQDFGERAARQLEAFARRQASLEESSRPDDGWRR